MEQSSYSNKSLLALALTLAITAAATIATAQDKGGFMRVEKTGSASPNRAQQQQTVEPLKMPRLITDFGKGIAMSVPGLAVTNKSEIYQRLLNVSVDSPSWPSFPRDWYEEQEVDTTETTTYWLPSLKVVNAGVEAEYKYAHKITFTMMKSLHKQGAPVGSTVDPDSFKMVVPDPTTHRVFPYLQEGHPMVGFCAFELQLTLSNGQSFGVEAFNVGVRGKHTKARIVTQTVFSKFFPIPTGKNVLTIMNEYCIDTFTKYVRPHVEKNFVPVMVEELFYKSPKNQCQPNAKDSSAGDFDCMKWFAGFDAIKKHTTVPRCELTKHGFNVCRLKAKETNRCPIYQDKKGQLHTQVNQFGLQEYTRASHAFACDKGLTCKITKQPITTLFGLVQFKGESFCSK